ncbi:hypothetical protein D3C78_1957860 [compost metagenome]
MISMITSISSVGSSISGDSSSISCDGRSAMVIIHADTSEAATRNITMPVVWADTVKTWNSCDGFSSR